ncbi:MAG: penicillin-binding protein 2 [Verrucomicrobia bacterium GWC2_42_7]|nr:MAG: penicillin-binding protein 2 [Verrucomicrobia bacterium GWC2_42_7]
MNRPFDFHRNSNPRLLIFYFIVVLALAILSVGLAVRQVFQSGFFRQQEKQQSLRRIIHPGPRGQIFDRNGKLLVGNRPRFSSVVYLGELRQEFRQEYAREIKLLRSQGIKDFDRQQVQSSCRAAVVQRYLDEINRILKVNYRINEKELEKQFRQRLLLPMTLIPELTPEAYAKLVEQIPVNSPIQIYTDTVRCYPYGSAAAHALGYVVSSDETLSEEDEIFPGEELTTFSVKGKVGKAGLEKQFDNELQGVCGGEIRLVDPAGFQYELLSKKKPQQGNNLFISIDIDIQRAAEEALAQRTGSAIALDVQTGEVLALVSKPDYDPNSLVPYIPTSVYKEIDAKGGWFNRAIQGLYPPASPFKLISSIALLRHHIVDKCKTESYCGGALKIGNRQFHCHKLAGHGRINLQEAIKNSCCVYYYEHVLKAGCEPIIEEARRFGFDMPTGIELPYESKGMIVPSPLWKKNKYLGAWTNGDTANMSIGQGYLLSTPIQMACFAASLARGETHTKPTILCVSESERSKIKHGGEPIHLSPEDYSFIIESMALVVESGTGIHSKLENVRVAGKTGTGQITVNGEKRHVVYFIAFAPVEKPQIAIAIAIEEKSALDNFSGSRIAAPVTQKILQKFFE